MNAADIVKECINFRKISQRNLAKKLNVTVQNLNQKLNRNKDMKCKDFGDIMDALDYQIVIKEKNK